MDSSQVLDKAILGMSKGKMHKGKAQKVRNPMTFLQNARYKPVKKYTYPDGRVEYRDEDGNKVQPPKKEEFHALAEVEP